MVPGPYLESFEFRPQYSSNPQIFHYLIPYVAAVGSLCALRRDRSRASELLPSAYQANVAATAAFRAVERDDVNGANWPSILLFSLCNLMFHFAAAQFTPPADFDFLEIFRHVLRGTGGLRRQLLDHLVKIGFLRKEDAPLRFGAPETAPRDVRDVEETQAALALLASATHPGDTPAATVAACDEALALLRRWAFLIGGAPRQWAHFFYWPCAVSQAFVAALEDRHPVALLIFVHWCAVMRRAPDAWFLDGWARRTAFAAMAVIAPTTDYGFLRWPVAVFDPV
ncbi:hypothetical protein F5Y12DRAFT_495479 [Xylaria sp. FL1777]|nr:hypothetical protein F5Y12DRAFT_495479 [Xylaria sp. FL1777]